MVLGVAGVGKTSFGRRLASPLGLKFIDLPELVREKRLYTAYDSEAQAYVIDLRRVSAVVGSLLRKESGVVASVYPFKPRGVRVRNAIVLRMNPLKLIEILEERRYPRWKIRENVSAELIDQPFVEAIRKFGPDKVIQLNVTDKSLDELAERVAEGLREGKIAELDERVDWIGFLEKSGRLEELLSFLEQAELR
ncbi:MAG: AAA family ATPase [Thaumarchaeota archaeon]|nr:AAA family ATPase [Nitrososphaerota archaeon]